MIYKSEIETDENKKAKKCPRCNNEQINVLPFKIQY